MSIRFRCSSCQQPIEVDDEWAGKLVACPYCRRTISAPTESTLDDQSAIPLASAMHGQTEAGAGGNTIALVALVLAGVVWLLLGISVAVMAPHHLEVAELTEALQRSAEDGRTQVQVFMEFVDSRGGVYPRWLVVTALCQIGAIMAWFAAMVCGLIGVTRVPRRGMAMGAVMMCSMVLVLFCAGGC